MDIAEILKDCPKGVKLHSIVHGIVTFDSIDDSSYVNHPVVVRDGFGNRHCFTRDGRLDFNFDGECILFPSKENRDWSTFNAPKKRSMLSYENIEDEFLKHVNVESAATRLCASEAKKLDCVLKLMRTMWCLNLDWKPDFNDSCSKYTLTLGSSGQIYPVETNYTDFNGFAFKTRELANEAIKILGEDVIRTAFSYCY